MGKIVQTAGRNTLGEFAPEFAHWTVKLKFSTLKMPELLKNQQRN